MVSSVSRFTTPSSISAKAITTAGQKLCPTIWIAPANSLSTSSIRSFIRATSSSFIAFTSELFAPSSEVIHPSGSTRTDVRGGCHLAAPEKFTGATAAGASAGPRKGLPSLGVSSLDWPGREAPAVFHSLSALPDAA